LLKEKLDQPAAGELASQPCRAGHPSAGPRMEFIPDLGPHGQQQATRPVPARELDPTPGCTKVADVSLAHGAARTELDSVYETGVRSASRAEDPRVQLERRDRQLPPCVRSGFKSEDQPRPEVAVETGGLPEHVVRNHAPNIPEPGRHAS